MMRFMVLFLAVGILSGCQFLQVVATQKIEPQANRNEKASIVLLTSTTVAEKQWLPASVIEACNAVKPAPELTLAPAIWAPIAGKLAFDFITEKMSTYIKETQERSNKSFSVKGVYRANQIRNTKCFVVYREAENGPSAAFVVQLEWAGRNAFVMKPLYAMAQNSISLTKCTKSCFGEGQKEGEITMSLALAQSAVVEDSAGVWHLRQLGSSAVSIPAIGLQTPGKLVKTSNRLGSELMPLPEGEAAIQVSFAITESGNVVSDVNTAQAEIKAIAAAIGPGIEAQISRHYKEN